MAIALSLLSALAYGVSDFLGGIFTRHSSPWRIATIGQLSSTLCVAIIAPFFAGTPTIWDFVFGALAGIGSGIGAAFLYRGLATAKMSVVAPISAVGAALIPVFVGFGLGDRPSILAIGGIVIAFPAIALISITRHAPVAHRSGVLDGVAAGVGFGFLFVFLGQVGPNAGQWPIAVMYVFSALSVVVLAMFLHEPWKPHARSDWWGLTLGPIGALAAIAFYVATNYGLLSIVSVISALYPASTVLLAALVLKERIQPLQAIGIFLAVVAVSLVALG